MEKVFRILVVLPTLNKCGGIESFYFNYYKRLSNKFKIDFITHENDCEEMKNIILNRGDNLYVMPKLSLKTMFKFKNRLIEFFAEHRDYDAIHCQMANASYYYFSLAKKYGINCRIMHSHQCKYADKLSHAIRNFFLIKLGKLYATDFMACGEDAGKFMFKNNFVVMNNSIDLSKFEFDSEIRKKLRDFYKISEKEIVIGNVGRLVPQKNQSFLIDIMQFLNENIKLIIIGNGELKEKLNIQIKEKGLKSRIVFIDSTTKINEYYNMFDIFLLPSLYEGLPVVGIEAQASGLKCIFSDSITKELKINKDVKFISLNKKTEWIKSIENIEPYNRKKYINLVAKSKFNIENEVKKLEQYYIDRIIKKVENRL